MIQICTFKEKGKERSKGRPQLGGQWKVLSLLALERFQAWWLFECSMFGGQWGNILFGGHWKVPNLVAFGMFHVWLPLEGEGKREGEATFSHSSIFHPIRFYLNIFSFILGFCFTMVLDHYFTFFFPFPWPVNYNHAFWGTKYFTHSSFSWFWSKIFFFLWIHGVAHDYILWALSRIVE